MTSLCRLLTSFCWLTQHKSVDCSSSWYNMPCFTLYFNATIIALCVYYAFGNGTSYMVYTLVYFHNYFFTVIITKGPVSVTVMVGANAQFHCAGTGVVITWEVDGLISSNPVISSRGIASVLSSSSGTVQSTLTVPATSVNNGTTVRCRLFSSSTSIFSNNSTLTVLPGNFMIACVMLHLIMLEKIVYY